MKPFIPTSVYGFINYVLALTLIASPWLFCFYNVSSAALFLPIFIGWLQLIMAIFSNNGMGFVKQFPVKIQMVISVAQGFILLVSPWLWTFSTKVWAPQLCFGLLLILMGIFTKKSPFLVKALQPQH